MTPAELPPIISRAMDVRGRLHLIEDDLRETWVEDWAGDGGVAIEDYLAKHLAFLSYLDDAAT